MFQQQTVTNCPVTSGSRGRILVPPTLIAEWVGTLDREAGNEWLILLHGKREDNGLTYRVTECSVPTNQKRHSTEVELPDIEEDPDVIGVLHSHHSMGAFFSSTDKTKLNPKYPISIVISSRLDSDEAKLLGFSYEATGFAKLPCGASGQLVYDLEPEDISDWPFPASPGFAVNLKFEGLGDCSKALIEVTEIDSFSISKKVEPTCQMGIDPIVSEGFKGAIFGRGGDSIAKLLPPPMFSHIPATTGGVRVKDRRRHRQSDAENYYGRYYQSIEVATRQECSWCKSWENVSEMIDWDGDLYCDDCFDFFERHLDKDELATVAGGLWEDVQWEGREAELVGKQWGHL